MKSPKHQNVPPHLLPLAGSFTQEALGSSSRQGVVIIEVCNRGKHMNQTTCWKNMAEILPPQLNTVAVMQLKGHNYKMLLMRDQPAERAQ